MRSLQANTRIIALVTNQGECSFNTRDIQYIVDHVSVQLQFINHQQKKKRNWRGREQHVGVDAVT